MALDFTKIKDQPGAAIIFIHDGTPGDEQDMQTLAEAVRGRTEKQIIIMSAKDSIAISIISFYQLRGTHFVLIVRDDDQLHHSWSNGDRFDDPSQIAYLAEQAG